MNNQQQDCMPPRFLKTPNMATIRDISINSPEENPIDSLQCIKWPRSPLQIGQETYNIFAAGGWDGYLRIYKLNMHESNNGQIDDDYKNH
jgi:WD40 repeat protein